MNPKEVENFTKPWPWLFRTTINSIILKGQLPWYLRLLWHLRLIKYFKGDFVIGPDEFQKEMYRKYFGYTDDEIEARHPSIGITGWKITIPW